MKLRLSLGVLPLLLAAGFEPALPSSAQSTPAPLSPGAVSSPLPPTPPPTASPAALPTPVMRPTPTPPAPAAPAAPNAVASPAVSPSASAARNPIGPAFGSNDPCTSLSSIVTRPTVTNSVCTVRPNHVLFESGWQNTSSTAGNVVQYPQGAVRLGTYVPALELDLTPPQIEQSSIGIPSRGLTDIGIGLKYVFGYTAKFAYGAQAFISAPTGGGGFSANASQSYFALNAQYALSPAFTLEATASGQSLNAISSSGNNQRYGSFVPSLVLSASLPASTSVYGEIAGFTQATGPGSGTRVQYILGASRDVGQRIQVDVETGISPTVSTGKYHYLGAGLSYYL